MAIHTNGANLATIITGTGVVTVPGTSTQPGGAYVQAVLAAGAAATLTIYNNTTAAGSRVGRLQTSGAGNAWTPFPIRCDRTVKVQLSTLTSSTIAFVYLV